MSIASDPALPYVQCGEHKFGKLTPRDRARLMADLKSRRKAELVANLDAAGIAGEDKFHTLNDFDGTLYGFEQWRDYVNSVEGQDAILRLALAKTDPGKAADPDTALDGLNLAGQELYIAAAVCGMSISEDAGPNPPAAPAEKTPEPGTVYGT